MVLTLIFNIKKIPKKFFFYDSKKLVPYKRTLVPFYLGPKFSSRYLIFCGEWMVQKNVDIFS